jgi:phosphoglycerate kinase
MKKPTCKLTQFNLRNKRVLLRADLNVPLAHGTIEDDFRLRAVLPTLNYLQQHHAITFIATHIGRPNGTYDPKLSTKILIPWFEKNGYSIIFEPDLKKAASMSYAPSSIILLENMRFFAGEQNHDPAFAQQLGACADYYVNDAFGTLHRDDTSVSLVADYFPPDKKTIGFLVQKELQELSSLKHNPPQPFVLIIGGGKVDTKLSLISGMLDSVSTILVCPAVVFTFLKAMGKNVGKSLVDEASIKTAQEIIKSARIKNINLLFPIDYQIAYNNLDGKLEIIEANSFPDNARGVSIGPKTIQEWRQCINNAKTIFFNAAMGFTQRPETLEGLHALLESIATSPAHTVVGGGDSVAAVERFKLTSKIDFLSTGGGATLAYLSGNALPGLQNL